MNYRNAWAGLASQYQHLAAKEFVMSQNCREEGFSKQADHMQREASRNYRIARWYLFGCLAQSLDPSAPAIQIDPYGLARAMFEQDADL